MGNFIGIEIRKPQWFHNCIGQHCLHEVQQTRMNYLKQLESSNQINYYLVDLAVFLKQFELPHANLRCFKLAKGINQQPACDNHCTWNNGAETFETAGGTIIRHFNLDIMIDEPLIDITIYQTKNDCYKRPCKLKCCGTPFPCFSSKKWCHCDKGSKRDNPRRNPNPLCIDGS